MPYNEEALASVADRAFSSEPSNNLRETHALVASLDGHVVFERYAPGFNAESTFLSWSMAKSVTSALAGVLVGKGLLDPKTPPGVPEWQDADDPRSEITFEQLLQMRSGLQWNEDYVDDDVSDVITMLFGQAKGDTAGYAAALPLEFEPGTVWKYSSGTTNIIARALGALIGGGEDGFRSALIDDLLVPAGLRNTTIKFDPIGTFIGSSFLYATARDYVAFGELFRNDGLSPDGTRLLPEGWVAQSIEDHATCPDSGQGYGLQWWLARDAYSSFAANGYEGQRLQVSQDLGLTFVRLGKTSADYNDELREFYTQVADCFV